MVKQVIAAAVLSLLSYQVSGQELVYDRKEFGSGWSAQGKHESGCRLDRRDVEIIESAISDLKVAGESGKSCKIEFACVYDEYTAKEICGEGRLIDLDHLVPLAEAWRSGASEWSKEQRRAFANDPANLIPTTQSMNRSKGDKDISEWLPMHNTCGYLEAWQTIKAKYHLSMDQAEQNAIDKLETECNSKS